MISAVDPVLFFFILGLAGGLAKSDLQIPKEITDAMSIYLLLAIGLKGGIQLHSTGLGQVWWPLLLTVGVGVIIPVVAFVVLRKFGKFSVADAAALAAHYGSTSVITFAVAQAYLANRDVEHEPEMVVLMVAMEIPAILVGLFLARILQGGHKVPWLHSLREVVLGKSVLLLLGGLLVGMVNGPERLRETNWFFTEPMKGVLALFMVGMGVAAAHRLAEVRQAGLFLVCFAIVMPIVSALIGIVSGIAAGFSQGGVLLMAVISASASYIAAPAAVRVALPEANPGYYLVASLGITFPFNVLVGIPLYFQMSNAALRFSGNAF